MCTRPDSVVVHLARLAVEELLTSVHYSGVRWRKRLVHAFERALNPLSRGQLAPGPGGRV
jgi:hypothetical protein